MADAVAKGSRFVWHELLTTDPERSIRFFEALFGWETREQSPGADGPYTVFQAGDSVVGGLHPAQLSPDTRPHWLAHVHVDDIDATIVRALDLGARAAAPPRDIPGVGRATVLVDPQGARVAPITCIDGPPPLPSTLPAFNTFCWNELLTTNVREAVWFYGGLFGWSHVEHSGHDGGHHAILRRGDYDAAGLMKLPADADHSSSWLPYLSVEEVEGCVARVGELGGSVAVETTVIPGAGRFAVLADPTGVAFAVFRSGATAVPTGICGDV